MSFCLHGFDSVFYNPAQCCLIPVNTNIVYNSGGYYANTQILVIYTVQGKINKSQKNNKSRFSFRQSSSFR